MGINGGLNIRSEIGVRHRRIAEFLLVRFRNSELYRIDDPERVSSKCKGDLKHT